MNRLRINQILAFVLLPVGAMTLMIFASRYETCQTPAMDTARLSANAMPNDEKPNNGTSHCLVYGKYCLGDALHSR
jgi:hypothetical protein